MSDIGPNSNRRQVALAVSDLQDQVGAGSVGAEVVAAQAAVDALELNLKVVAGPQTLAETTYLTVAVLRKTLTVAAGPNNSTVATAHGITSPVAVIGCAIRLKSGANHLIFGGGGWLGADIASSILVTIDGTNVNLISGATGNFAGYAGEIVLLYTLA